MIRRLFIFACAAILAAACQPNNTPPAAPTDIPFPTVTPGAQLRGILVTQDRSSRNVSSAATVAAVARQPTATPNTGLCPTVQDDLRLPVNVPEDHNEINEEIVSFLSAGGSPGVVRDTLADEWNLLAENGFVWTNLDLTGEGVPEIIASYQSPEQIGVLVIFSCEEGRYFQRYQALSDEADPPEIITFGDMNLNQLTDLVFTSRSCDETLGECNYRVHVVAWSPVRHQFVSLLATSIISGVKPEILDTDQDRISEIVLRLRNEGNSRTGPLRTGVAIYDWNGSAYVLSIWQPDAPKYRIQIVHEADRYFDERNMVQATINYNTALIDEELDDWFSDEQFILESYIYYRMLLARTFAGDPPDQLSSIYQRLSGSMPEGAPPNVYMQLGSAFWEDYLINNNISNACSVVQSIIETRPDALEFLNRYGNRSRVYSTNDLCPF